MLLGDEAITFRLESIASFDEAIALSGEFFLLGDEVITFGVEGIAFSLKSADPIDCLLKPFLQ